MTNKCNLNHMFSPHLEALGSPFSNDFDYFG
jgi:hypothetical protein